MGERRVGAAVLLRWVAAISLLVAAAGCHASAGPQLGYTFGRGVNVGWEAGVGLSGLKANVGQIYQAGAASGPATANGDAAPGGEEGELQLEVDPGMEIVTYGVLEPWFVIGLTGGFGYSNLTGLGGVLGVWEGAAVPIDGSYDDLDPDNDLRVTFVSGAIGYRYANGTHGVYLTPKIGIADGSVLAVLAR